jgi:RNA polymerase sigma factor (sigma-70 family)
LTWDIQHLFRCHARQIAKSLRRRGIDAETAADLTQDTFVKVLASNPSGTASGYNPAAYLFRAARNLSIDHYRRERVAAREYLSDKEFADIVDPSPTAETIVYDRQKLQRVEAALAELPRRVREAFELHRMGEMTLVEVAKKLDMSTTRTWTLIRDAYEHIEDRLNGF